LTIFHLVSRLRMSTAIPLLSLRALIPSAGTTLLLNPHDSNVSTHTHTHTHTHTQSWEERDTISTEQHKIAVTTNLTLLLYIHEILSLNTRLKTGYPDKEF
jgi:hypothetical protein